jgi:hypothetical protein
MSNSRRGAKYRAVAKFQTIPTLSKRADRASLIVFVRRNKARKHMTRGERTLAAAALATAKRRGDGSNQYKRGNAEKDTHLLKSGATESGSRRAVPL